MIHVRQIAPIIAVLVLLATGVILLNDTGRESLRSVDKASETLPEKTDDSADTGSLANGHPEPFITPGIAERARTIAAALTLEQKCAQVLMVSLGGAQSLTDEFRDRFTSTPAGAVLLLGENIAGDAEAVIDLTSTLEALAFSSGGGVPAFIAIDHEGGTVYRLGDIATWIPGAARIGRAGASREEVYDLYLNAARQIRTLGFTMNLAPILEPLGSENRDFLEHRAFSADPEEAARYGGIMIDAMRDGGILAIGKHFPGSGMGDPHERLPVFSFDADDPENAILPFRKTILEHRLAGIMTSHALVPSLDPEFPVTISARIQQSYLRDEIGFEGIILTDDLNMRAIARRWSPVRAAVLALQAGADMIMYLGGDFVTVHAGIVRAAGDGALSPERLEEAVVRILEQKLMADLWSRYPAGKRPGEDPPSERERRLEAFERLKSAGDELSNRFRRPQP